MLGDIQVEVFWKKSGCVDSVSFLKIPNMIFKTCILTPKEYTEHNLRIKLCSWQEKIFSVYIYTYIYVCVCVCISFSKLDI